MAYSKKVVDKFENTLKNPEKFNVGRFDPKDGDVGTDGWSTCMRRCNEVTDKVQTRGKPTHH